MDEKLDILFFEKLTNSVNELFWVDIIIGEKKMEIPYMLIPKEQQPSVKIKKLPAFEKNTSNEDIRKGLDKELEGSFLDYIDTETYIDDLTSVKLEMIKRGIDKTNYTDKEKEKLKEGFTSMREYYPTLFGMISRAIEKDIEERAELFLGGQETQK